MSWFVYMLRCRDRSLYTGVARDVEARLAMHRSRRGSKYVRSRLPFRLVLCESRRTRGAAQKRECQIKALSRRQKLTLIQKSNLRRIYSAVKC